MSEARTWTVLELLRWTADYFGARGMETARLDAEVLLAFALGTKRLQLYVDFEKPVSEAERGRFRELVRRRAEERARLARELQKTEAMIERRTAKLANPGFVDKAPEHVVEGERERLAEDEGARAKLAEALARLQAA